MPRIRRTKSASDIENQAARLYVENNRRFFNGESDSDRGARILNTRDRYFRNIARVPRVNRLVNVANNPRTERSRAERANTQSMNIQIPRNVYMGMSKSSVAK